MAQPSVSSFRNSYKVAFGSFCPTAIIKSPIQ